MLLSQNSELRPHRIWNWSIPALTAVLKDGSRLKTCPSAGICASVCYARNGTYMFSNVLAAHHRNLQLVIDDHLSWRNMMIEELKATRFTKQSNRRALPIPDNEVADAWLLEWCLSGKPAIRIHDAGDFFADWYLQDWLYIASQSPDILFYAYTKEIEMLSKVDTPANFRWLASTGGTQDHLITDDLRHAEVFPNDEAMVEAGYLSQDASDLLAVLLPTNRIGIPANNIKHFNKRIAGRTFGEMQSQLNSRSSK